MRFLGAYDRPRSRQKKEAGFFARRRKTIWEEGSPIGQVLRNFPGGVAQRILRFFLFLCRMTASLGSTLRGQSSFLIFLNMRKQICLLIGALALLGAITGCGNAESAKSLGKKSEADDDAAQVFKLGMKYWSLKRGQLAGVPVGLPEDNSQAIK